MISTNKDEGQAALVKSFSDVSWIRWKRNCCHLDEMKVRVMSPGWGGSWLISSDGTVQPNSCSFLSWLHVKLCWPMTIISGGGGIHAMCFFYQNERIALTHVDFIVASLCSHLWYHCIVREILDLIYCLNFPLIQPALSKCTRDIGLELLCSFLHLRFEPVNAGKCQ